MSKCLSKYDFYMNSDNIWQLVNSGDTPYMNVTYLDSF